MPAVPALARSAGLTVGEEVLCFLRETTDVSTSRAISCYFGARGAQGAAFKGQLDCYPASAARAVEEIALQTKTEVIRLSFVTIKGVNGNISETACMIYGFRDIATRICSFHGGTL